MRKIAIACFALMILCLCFLWRENSTTEVPERIHPVRDESRPEPVSQPNTEFVLDSLCGRPSPETSPQSSEALPPSHETPSPSLETHSPSPEAPPDGAKPPKIELAFIKELREQYKNEDIIGYLRIEGTAIDYPVTQSLDNDFYLEHDIYGNGSASGWIFLDYENDVARNDKNIVIYGHNMRKDIMFHSLRYYTSEDFYKNHSYIIFNTIYEKGVWGIFSFYKCDINFRYTQVVFPSQEDFYDLISEMKAKSLYDTGLTVTREDIILTLSTCVGGSENERYVLNARKLRPEELPNELKNAN